jgi:hypothetical protein
VYLLWHTFFSFSPFIFKAIIFILGLISTTTVTVYNSLSLFFPFGFNHYFQIGSCICDLDCRPPICASFVAEMTGMHHKVQLIVAEIWSQNFAPAGLEL